MTYAARLFLNNKNWTQPTDVDENAYANNGYGVLVETPSKNEYRFGFEEWLCNETPANQNIGFLECYRNAKHEETASKIMLYTKIKNNLFHVGNIHEVNQLNNHDINNIKNELTQLSWNDVIQNHFQLLQDRRLFNNHSEYLQHWNSSQIICNQNEAGFCFNITYKKLEVFTEDKFVNLSSLDTQNSFFHNWQYLSRRFVVENLIEKLSESNPLKKYLQNQIN